MNHKDGSLTDCAITWSLMGSPRKRLVALVYEQISSKNSGSNHLYNNMKATQRTMASQNGGPLFKTIPLFTMRLLWLWVLENESA